MGRALRIEFPGAFYHVMSRGNARQAIYLDRRDRLRFLELLASATERYGAAIHCYSLMDNHYHLLLETPQGNLARIMRHINGSYSTWFNTRHERVGHLFQGRYRAILVDVDSYFLTLSRYIHRNRLDDGTGRRAWAYEWSSYGDYLSVRDGVDWLRRELLFSLMGGRAGFEERYRGYVEGDDRGFAAFYDERAPTLAVLGGDRFVDRVMSRHRPARARDIPAARPQQTPPDIGRVFHVVASQLQHDGRLARRMSIYLCHRFSGCSLREIGAYFGVGESAVAENSRRFAVTLCRDQRLAETVAGLLAELES